MNDRMDKMDLQNSKRHYGIIVCGYNYGVAKGESENHTMTTEPIDEGSNELATIITAGWPYARGWQKWFRELGHPLDGTNPDFERSIYETNWSTTKTTSFREDLRGETEILVKVEDIKPKIIFFSGIGMLREFSKRKSLEVEWQGRIGFAKYDTIDIIGIPHVSFPWNRTTNLIKSVEPTINTMLQSYKSSLNPF